MTKKFPKLYDLEFLTQQLELKRSVRDVANDLGCSIASVEAAFKRFCLGGYGDKTARRCELEGCTGMFQPKSVKQRFCSPKCLSRFLVLRGPVDLNPAGYGARLKRDCFIPPIRQNYPQPQDMSLDVYESIVAYLEGATFEELLEKYQVTATALAKRIYRLRKAYGLTNSRIDAGRPRGRGAEAPCFKTGRITDKNGYELVLVDKSDALVVAMAHKQNYIPEHRVVMARYLGRPLTRREQVHHKDGNRANNVIENLQLRQLGPHGPGAAFQCQDCGSHNIKAVDI